MDAPRQHSQLFSVRIWKEQVGDDQFEFRGKVQHVLSSEACHFREWATLEAFLEAKMHEQEAE